MLPRPQLRQLQHPRRKDSGRGGRLVRPAEQSSAILPRHNLHNLTRNFAVVHSEPPNRHRQPKPPRTGTPRIEVKHTVFLLLFGHMTMSVNDEGKSRSIRLQIQFSQVMQYVDGDAANFKYVGRGNFPRPDFAIHVAAYGSHRRNRSQIFQDVRIADVASMNDVVGSAQGGKSLRTKQTVRVGDDADKHTP